MLNLSLPILPEEVWMKIVTLCDPLPRSVSRLINKDIKTHTSALFIQRNWKRGRVVPRPGSIVALYPRRGPDKKRMFVLGVVTEATRYDSYKVRSVRSVNTITYFLYGPRDPRFRVSVIN